LDERERERMFFGGGGEVGLQLTLVR
jgi:hypothetical protein